MSVDRDLGNARAAMLRPPGLPWFRFYPADYISLPVLGGLILPERPDAHDEWRQMNEVEAT